MCACQTPPEAVVGDRGAGVAQPGALEWTACPRSSGTLGAGPAASSTGLWAPDLRFGVRGISHPSGPAPAPCLTPIFCSKPCTPVLGWASWVMDGHGCHRGCAAAPSLLSGCGGAVGWKTAIYVPLRYKRARQLLSREHSLCLRHNTVLCWARKGVSGWMPPTLCHKVCDPNQSLHQLS